MNMRVLSVTLLLLLAYALSSAYNGRLPSRRFSAPCCIRFTTRNIRNAVTGNTYEMPPTKSPCVKAIILKTLRGPACVNPKEKWIKDLIANMTKE